MDERTVAGDGLVVDVRAVARLLVADHEVAARGHNLSVIAGHFAAGQAQVVRLTPADAERLFADRHDPPAERVRDLQPGVWHFEGKSINSRVPDAPPCPSNGGA